MSGGTLLRRGLSFALKKTGATASRPAKLSAQNSPVYGQVEAASQSETEVSDQIGQFNSAIDTINDFNSGVAVLGKLDAALLVAPDRLGYRKLNVQLLSLLKSAASKIGAL